MNMDIVKVRTLIDLIRNEKNVDDTDRISSYFEDLYKEIDPLVSMGFKVKDIIASVLISNKNIMNSTDSDSLSTPKLLKELVMEDKKFSLFDDISFEIPSKDKNSLNSLDHVTCTIVDICDEYIIVDDVEINKKISNRCIFGLEEIHNIDHF